MRTPKKRAALTMFLVVGITLPVIVLAQQCGQQCPPGVTVCIRNPLQWCSIREVISAVVYYLWLAGTPFVVLMVLIGAFYIITAGGSEQRVSTGKKYILYAVIGFAILLFARGVIALIYAILGIS